MDDSIDGAAGRRSRSDAACSGRYLWPSVGFFIFLVATTLAPAEGPEEVIDNQVREISKTLRCAVCQSESVWESNAELARQMREIIRERLKAGESADAIRAYFVSRYGDFILLRPRMKGSNAILWFGPFLLLAIGAGLLYRALRKWEARGAAGHSRERLPLDLDDEEQNNEEEAILQSYQEKK